ncbi:MAG: tetratricopeptide repeat protein [candidate division WOR-3 bacterium]
MQSGEIEVLMEIGQSYLMNKEYDKAINKFSEALKINPHDPELYYYLGLAYEQSGRLEQAEKMYEKAIMLDRSFSNAEIRLSEVRNKIAQERAM